MPDPETTALSPGLALPAADAALAAPEVEVLTREDVMRRYNRRLFRLAFALVGDEAEAEDVLRDSYLRAFERRSTFAGRSGLGTRLARIVRSQAIDHVRIRQARQAAIALETELPPVDEGQPGLLDRAVAPAARARLDLDRSRDEARAALQQAIAALPLRFRAVIVLREVEGLSVEETADYLDVPLATVKSRDYRARRLLRKELGADFEGLLEDAFEFRRQRCDRIVQTVLALLTRPAARVQNE